MTASPPRVAVARWEDVPGERVESYWRRLAAVGLQPIDLHEPGASLNGYAGLVLTGGIDIDPARYGQQRHEKVRNTNPARDDFEIRLLDQALSADLPVLAICRGHQLLNVCFGGTLVQHIESYEHMSQRDALQTSRQHAVEIAPGSRLREVLGSGRIVVNSRHHQAVTLEGLAAGLIAVALSPDGFVEAVQSERHRWVIGVQWHPERDEPQIPDFRETSGRLFRAFAGAVTSPLPIK